MTVEMEKYKFTIANSASAPGKVVGAFFSGQAIIRHAIKDAGPDDAERLFTLESNTCGGKSVDLVIQIGPGKNGDVMTRIYYRILFSTDLKSVISEFYDPSVSTVNAVLPIQSVEGISSPETSGKITCKKAVPVVVEYNPKQR